MNNLSEKLQKVIVWLTAYLNLIAFMLAGGYIFLKTEYETVKNSAKNALYLLCGFTAIDLLRSLIYNILLLANVEYKTLNVISDIGTAVLIIKVVVFVVFMALDLCGIQLVAVKNEKQETVVEESETNE